MVLQQSGAKAEAVIELPALDCGLSAGVVRSRPGRGEKPCTEHRYQFLNTRTCQVSAPLIAKDAL